MYLGTTLTQQAPTLGHQRFEFVPFYKCRETFADWIASRGQQCIVVKAIQTVSVEDVVRNCRYA